MGTTHSLSFGFFYVELSASTFPSPYHMFSSARPVHSFGWFPSIPCQASRFPSHMLLWVNKSPSNDKTAHRWSGWALHANTRSRPPTLSLSRFLSLGRQRRFTNIQGQSPANLLHSGQRVSSRDKQPPVVKPVLCGQRVGRAFRPGSNSG